MSWAPSKNRLLSPALVLLVVVDYFAGIVGWFVLPLLAGFACASGMIPIRSGMRALM